MSIRTPRKATVYDVAAEAGVSIATVSRALRTPDKVRPKTRDIINEAIHKLEYVPSGSAQGLAAQKTGSLGLFLPNVDELDTIEDFNPENQDAATLQLDPPDERPQANSLYLDEVLRGCELESWRQGVSLMVNVSLGRADADVTQIANDMAGKVDGLLVMARSLPDHVVDFLSKRMPLVMIADAPTSIPVDLDLVRVSNRKGMSALVSHLIESHGVKRLAYLAGPNDSPDNHKRYEGFCEALQSHGMTYEAAPIYRGQFSQSIAYSITKDLIARSTLPEALVCANDQMALGALEALDEANIDIPGQIIVTGFDGIDETNMSAPRLTTVRQPMRNLGRAAVQLLMQRINNPSEGSQSLELPVTVLLRESCEGHLDPIG